MPISFARLPRSLFYLGSLLFLNSALAFDPQACFKAAGQQFDQVLGCYYRAIQDEPLDYQPNSSEHTPKLSVRDYTLSSQTWPLDANTIVAADRRWKHNVRLYIPADARDGIALLAITGGGQPSCSTPGVDLPALRDLALRTRTIVVTINCVPNQPLHYSDSPDKARVEDDIVAHGWRLFLDDPTQHPFLPLHVPMMGAAVKAMDLASKELAEHHIEKFIVTGVSKRGWAAWLTAIADPRVVALAPGVIDILNMSEVIAHTYQVYGQNWPIDYTNYYSEGITERYRSPEFAQLSQIEDPLSYLHGPYKARFQIPKYLINASGDGFFPPDNARLYLDRLPEPTMLDVLPNSDHYIERHETYYQHLGAFVDRIQAHQAMPTLNSVLISDAAAGTYRLLLNSSEKPVTALLWQAENPQARDFRLACHIGYHSTPVTLQEDSLSVTLKVPQDGWQANFVQLTYRGGMVLTTPVYVLPDTYPSTAPPDLGDGCRTLPPKP